MEWRIGQVIIDAEKDDLLSGKIPKDQFIIRIMDEYFDYWHEIVDDKIHFIDRLYKLSNRTSCYYNPFIYNIEKCKYCKCPYLDKKENNYCKNKCVDYIIRQRAINNTLELFFDNYNDIINWIKNNSNGNEIYYNLLNYYLNK